MLQSVTFESFFQANYMAVDRPNDSLRKLRPGVAQYTEKAENSYAVRTEFW